MSQSLEEFCKEQHEQIDEFKKQWLEKNKESNENYPLVMKDGNEGLWWEMLQDFGGNFE